jgi:tetratricopeptide (TPR) repeat protein
MSTMTRHLLVVVFALLFAVGCRRASAKEGVSERLTLAELRSVKGAVLVTPPGEPARRPYRRERLPAGAKVTIPEGGLAWMRRDGGATFLFAGPGELVLETSATRLSHGRAFVDGEVGEPVAVETPRGRLELADARASVDVKGGAVSAYVLRGSARAENGERATAGELLVLGEGGKVTREPVLAWEDWTGGLGTADPGADPAPFGIGTVGARKPGDQGKPRFSMVIQRLDVKVTIERDFAITEVDETFVNPSSDVVEGLFSFRTPEGAVLQRFGVDRNGDLVWGRVKESAEAVQQYESNVYAGSEEDPALLQWAGRGVYNARLYPIPPGSTRRVVTRYAEWLSRQGPRGERRLYVYPMAAEGAKGSLPRIEELTVTLDVSRAGATTIRAGMGATFDGKTVVVKAFDFVPRADLSVELFDLGGGQAVAYRAPHDLAPEDVPDNVDGDFARTVEREEAPYLAVPVRAPHAEDGDEALDLAIVIDTSAATESSALAISRTIASSLLSHLGPRDRAALFAGDASLRPVTGDSAALSAVDRDKRKRWLAGLAAVERGGATDLGALLTEAASRLDPKRRGAVVYVGDGAPSVGELMPDGLRARLSRLPSGTRILAAAVGTQPNLPVLESVVRGAPVEHVFDAYGAARAALRLLEASGRALWLGSKVELGPGVDRVLPRELPPVFADETLMVVGRVTGNLPKELTLRGSGGVSRVPLSVRTLEDGGDLRRRWGEERMTELLRQGAGRASVVDVGRRFGVVSPFTSLYVPTRREAAAEEPTEEREAVDPRARLLRWKPWAQGGMFLRSEPVSTMAPVASLAQAIAPAEDSKEGGTGTRAKGEEGAMAEKASARFSPTAAEAPSPGSAGLKKLSGAKRPMSSSPTRRGGGRADEPTPAAPAAPAPEAPEEVAAQGNMFGDESAAPTTVPAAPPVASAAAPPAPLGLSGLAAGGGGLGVDAAKPGPVAGTGSGQGFGAGHGRLGGSHSQRAPKLRGGDVEVSYDDVPSDSEPYPKPGTPIGFVGHRAVPCGPGADLPFAERLVLFRERLGSARTVTLALRVYRRALADCEATDARERSALLLQLVDHLPTIRDRVGLFRALMTVSPEAADAVYRFLLLRINTSSDLREFHDALGLERLEPSRLAALLAKAKTPAERLAMLRGTAEQFPDDTELALTVLEAYEDIGDDAGGRSWARKLRRRADATAHVRTNVGEYYLRLSARGTPAEAKRDAEEARRTFGELVEFAPEDPLTRRLLGDLLRSHGFYDEALRQYQTLAALTPDDPSVPLLIAAASQGSGKVEEAVRWAEKASQSGSPDAASPVPLAARALSSAFLAWARLDAAKRSRPDDLSRLRVRASRLAASESGEGVRVIVSWSHPELRPALWTNALGSVLPAEDNLPLLGVAQAFVPRSPAPRIELRLDPEDAARVSRLGAKATVTVIQAEGAADERIARFDVVFRGADGKPRDRVALRFDGGALTEEAR